MYLPLINGPFLTALKICSVAELSSSSFKEFSHVSKSAVIRTGRFQLFERVTKFDFGFIVVFLLRLVQ